MKNIVCLSTRFLLLSKILLFVIISLFLFAISKVGYSIILLVLLVHLAFFIGDIFLGKPFIYIKNGYLSEVSYLRVKKIIKLSKDYEIVTKRNHFDLILNDQYCCSIYDKYYFLLFLFPILLDKRKERLNKKIENTLLP